MATISVEGSGVPTPLEQMLNGNEAINPGSDPSYELCKQLFLYHPLGKKMTEGPINIAQSQPRKITISDAPEEAVRDAFLQEWTRINADVLIAQAGTIARTYGVSALSYGIVGKPTDIALALNELWKEEIYFNVFDPLNTAGSMVTDQNPNSPTYQKVVSVSAAGQPYHKSRAVVIMNEQPVYIAYTSSSYGYVGRSVFQRALFPMKTFIQSMVTDDMVTMKAGLLVAMMKQAGAIIDNIMSKAAGLKRGMLKIGRTGQVLSIDKDEKIESLDMHNADVAMTTARKNVLENIAAAADMPAQMLNSETFAEGFGEGTEDAKTVVRFIEYIRKWLAPLYSFMDNLVMYRAWNPEFIQSMRDLYGDVYGYAKLSDEAIFQQWRKSFKTAWPSLLIEPESEQAKNEDVKLKAIFEALAILAPMLDPANKTELIDWAIDNINENRIMFRHSLDLDLETLREYIAQQQQLAQQAISAQEGEQEENEESGKTAPRALTRVS